MSGAGPWRIRLSVTAEEDFGSILRWTAERFAEQQARTYANTLIEAIEVLTEGPFPSGARQRDDVVEGLMALHVARQGRRGRHLVLYRVAAAERCPTIDVLRLLHDSMDLERHFSPQGS